jgi:hypothetical protein
MDRAQVLSCEGSENIRLQKARVSNERAAVTQLVCPTASKHTNVTLGLIPQARAGCRTILSPNSLRGLDGSTLTTRGNMKTIEVQGKQVYIKGNRCFAVPKSLSLTERVANMSGGPGNWDQQMRIPDPRVRNTRSIRG